jgi:hypothetical protein
MDTISSTEFRKRFASLEQPVLVTVNGHSLGLWAPVHSPEARTIQIEVLNAKGENSVSAWGRDPTPAERSVLHERPFTPVPKPTRRK